MNAADGDSPVTTMRRARSIFLSLLCGSSSRSVSTSGRSNDPSTARLRSIVPWRSSKIWAMCAAERVAYGFQSEFPVAADDGLGRRVVGWLGLRELIRAWPVTATRNGSAR